MSAIQETIAMRMSDDPNALVDVTNNELAIKVSGNAKVNATISNESTSLSSIAEATRLSPQSSGGGVDNDHSNSNNTAVDNDNNGSNNKDNSGSNVTSDTHVNDDDNDNKEVPCSSTADNEDTPTLWCRGCYITETCQWRRGPLGLRTLCNACYWRWKLKNLPNEEFTKPVFSQTESSKMLKYRKRKRNLQQDETERKKKRGTTARTAKATTITTMTAAVKQSSKPSTPPQPPAAEETNETDVVADASLNVADQLRKRKEYLRAGMYSTAFKHIVRASSRRQRRMTAKEFVRKNGASAFKMSLPIHQGVFELEKEKEFRIPLDIVQQASLGLPLERPHYTKIKSNLFVERKPNKSSAPVCQCRPPSDGSPGCTDNCLNKMLFYECDPETCPCGEQCNNQRFKRKEFVKELEVFPTRGRGWGLRTCVDLKMGTLITEYIGEIISRRTCMQRMQTIYKGQHNFYFLGYNNGEVIDAGSKGNEARFINHSCEPNCHIEKWTSDGEYCLGVFASKDIPAGSELFYDYKFSLFKSDEILQICRCGSANCSGTLGKKPTIRDSSKQSTSPPEPAATVTTLP